METVWLVWIEPKGDGFIVCTNELFAKVMCQNCKNLGWTKSWIMKLNQDDTGKFKEWGE